MLIRKNLRWGYAAPAVRQARQPDDNTRLEPPLPENASKRMNQLRNPLHAAVPHRHGMRSKLPISRSNL